MFYFCTIFILYFSSHCVDAEKNISSEWQKEKKNPHLWAWKIPKKLMIPIFLSSLYSNSSKKVPWKAFVSYLGIGRVLPQPIST